MHETIRNNINFLPYSLHDRRVCALEASGDTLTLRFSDGLTKISDPCELVEGCIVFDHVDWDFCCASVMEVSAGGRITGERLSLTDFIARYPAPNFEIVDETYGYNQSKFAGFLSIGEDLPECVIEIYHPGSMRYITEE